jgi:hypothetical protein
MGSVLETGGFSWMATRIPIHPQASVRGLPGQLSIKLVSLNPNTGLLQLAFAPIWTTQEHDSPMPILIGSPGFGSYRVFL